MSDIFILYRYGYEYCIALRAYSSEKDANSAKVKCEEYEKANPYPDSFDNDDPNDSDIKDLAGKWEEWENNHPFKTPPAELGYLVKSLILEE